MKRYASILMAGLAAALLAFPASAQTATDVAECDKARDPVRCEARQHAREACKDKRGREKQQCLFDKQPLPDCSKAEDQAHCEARQKARSACQGKPAKELNACMREQARGR